MDDIYIIFIFSCLLLERGESNEYFPSHSVNSSCTYFTAILVMDERLLLLQNQQSPRVGRHVEQEQTEGSKPRQDAQTSAGMVAS